MFGLTVVTPPAQAAVSIEQAKKHLNVTHADDDSYIEALVAAATRKVESETSRRMMTQVLRFTFDRFPGGTLSPVLPGARPLQLPVAPVTAVGSINYYDPQGAAQVWDPAKYIVDLTSEPPRLAPAYGQIYPVTQYRIAAAWIDFTAGYASPDVDPDFAALMQALLLTLASWYEIRESVVTGTVVNEVPNSAEWILRPLRLFPAAG